MAYNKVIELAVNDLQALIIPTPRRGGTRQRKMKPLDNLKRKIHGKAGKDEIRSHDQLQQMVDFILEQDLQAEKGRKRIPSLSQVQKELADFHEMIERSSKNLNRRTTNTLQSGRFYSFHYKARHHEDLEHWDTRPFVLVLEAKYFTHWFKVKSDNVGFIGINFHYFPIRIRRQIMRQIIVNMPLNRKRYMDNRPLSIQAIAAMNNVRLMVKKYKAIRQYLRPGNYINKHGVSESAGAFRIIQVPYAHVVDALSIPAPRGALFAKGKPKGL